MTDYLHGVICENEGVCKLVRRNSVILLVALSITIFIFSACTTKQENTVLNTTEEIQQEVNASGIVKAKVVKDLVVDFPGIIKQVNVSEGQKVKKGDSLFVIDIFDYQLQIANKQHELTAAEFELQRLLNSASGEQKIIKKLKGDLAVKQEALTNNSDSDIQKAMNNLKYLQEVYTKALNEFSVKEELFKSDAISATELKEAEKDIAAKKNDVGDARYAVEVLKDSKKKEVDELKETIDQKLLNVDGLQSGFDSDLINIQKEKVAILEADIKQMRDRLNKSFIREDEIISDMDNGVVYDISYVQGNKFNTSEKLLSILDLNSLVIQADVSEEFIKDVKLGADVVVIPQLDKNKKYKGKVSRISKKAIKGEDSTSIPIEITIDKKDDSLVADSSVDVKIRMVG